MYNRYKISSKGVRAMEAKLLEVLSSLPYSKLHLMHLGRATRVHLRGFIHHSMRGFLRGDLYTALSEILHKGQGSFGIQVHSPLEPGVVVVASKGQPMGVSFRQGIPMVLFASESAALEVPFVEDGQGGSGSSGSGLIRVDLDNEGEVFRVGVPSDLNYGTYSALSDDSSSPATSTTNTNTAGASEAAALVVAEHVEIRAYSVLHLAEATAKSLRERSLYIHVYHGKARGEGGNSSKTTLHKPSSSWAQSDLVGKDIADIPRTIKEVSG